MTRWVQKKISELLNNLWKLFLNGFLAILPIALTIVIFKITLNLIISWLEPLRPFVPTYLDIPYGEVILAILIIFLFGIILKLFIMRSLINAIENFLIKLPLVRPIYSGIKQLVQAFSAHDQITFKKVVLIEFPRKGVYSIGFLTSELAPDVAPNKEEKFYNIFIPTTPNPTSGYFIILPEREIMVISISRQDAMAMIISGGIIQPKRHF
jgi:uncharacterized membrane protein